MRIAFLSDIHGNLEAFCRVLEDVNGQDTDAVVCLGDCVGYGPEPEQVVRLLYEEKIPSVLGNHEEAIMNEELLSWFNPHARRALIRTREMLSADTLKAIGTWPRCLVFHDVLCVHGFPPDSVRRYLFEVDDFEMAAVLRNMPQKMCCVGHTHLLEVVGYDGARLKRSVPSRGAVSLDRGKHIVNVGSVGQPRDGDNRAKYVIWDAALHRIEVRFVSYDIARTARRILEVGMPEVYAWRLW